MEALDGDPGHKIGYARCSVSVSSNNLREHSGPHQTPQTLRGSIPRQRASSASIRTASCRQVHNRLPGFISYHLCHQTTVAGHRIVFETEEAALPLASQCFRLREFYTRLVRGYMLSENHLHSFGMTRPHRIAPRLRCSQPLQMVVVHTKLI